MPPLTDNGLPYPPAGVTPNVPYDLEQLARALDPLMVDTGWISLDYEDGFTDAIAGSLQIRRIGMVVYLRGGANGTFPRNSYTRVTAIGAIPVELRPASIVRTGCFAQSGRGGGVEITSAGNVNFVHDADVAPAWMAASASWIYD